MRGKLDFQVAARMQKRITPADAGKTECGRNCSKAGRDHPRGCGENSAVFGVELADEGSPPRMRGKPIDAAGDLIAGRITPADAGKT